MGTHISKPNPELPLHSDSQHPQFRDAECANFTLPCPGVVHLRIWQDVPILEEAYPSAGNELEKLPSVRSEIRGQIKTWEGCWVQLPGSRSLQKSELCKRSFPVDAMQQATLKNCLHAMFLAKAGKSWGIRRQEWLQDCKSRVKWNWEVFWFVRWFQQWVPTRMLLSRCHTQAFTSSQASIWLPNPILQVEGDSVALVPSAIKGLFSEKSGSCSHQFITWSWSYDAAPLLNHSHNLLGICSQPCAQ